jgi:peptidoglycan-associated lipoprotein
MRNIWIFALIVLVLSLFVACGPKPPGEEVKMEEEPTPEVTKEEPPEQPVPTQEEVEEIPIEERVKLEMIHFEFDRYRLLPEAKQILNENGRLLKMYPQVKILIEGHCDERGTIEYNLALGEKRARAAQEYLENLGIDPSRISIISYGKERPLDLRHNEDAWYMNRRDEFKIKSK